MIHREGIIKQLHLFVFLLIAVFLVSCSSGETETIYDTPSPMSPTQATEEVPTAVDGGLESTGISITSTPELMPTLTVEEIEIKVEELMKTNGGCELPCWWGIQPGSTSWENAYRFMTTFDSDIYMAGDPDESLLAEATISSNTSTRSEIKIRLIIINQVVDEIQIRNIDDPSFQFPSILQRYGMPEEVWIHSFSSYMGVPPPVHLFLYYKERGYFVQFYSTTETKYEGNSIYACLDSAPELFLTSPDPAVSFVKFSSIFEQDWGDECHPVLPINEALEMDVQQFYDQYQSGEESCFQMDREIWPEP